MSITASDIKKLAGKSFTLPNMAGGSARFDFPSPFPPGWPKVGLEAYVVPVTCTRADGTTISAVLKNFKEKIPVRPSRTSFLVQSGLAKDHAFLFQGVPFAWVDGVIVEGVPITGHVTKFVGDEYGGGAEDLRIVRQNDKMPADFEQRKELASNLASAIEILEAKSIVHGDISPGNVMLAPSEDQTGQACNLIDFDGFFHSSLPKIPLKHNGANIRPIGSAGYQYPELMQRARADTTFTDDNVFVATDRFAMAVMCLELAIWDDEVSQILGSDPTEPRENLLTEDMILKRTLQPLGQIILNKFPEGVQLLEEAMNAAINDMPSPAEWLKILGDQQTDFANIPHVEVFRVSGTRQRLIRRANLTNPGGDFSPIDGRLKSVQYGKSADGLVSIAFGWQAPVIRKQANGRVRTLQNDEIGNIAVSPGDEYSSNGWRLIFHDGEDARINLGRQFGRPTPVV